MKPRRRTVGLVAALVAATGCTSLEQGAKDEFAKDYSCPADRIEVIPRTDLNIHDITFGPRSAPPPDVASDPQRLAIWEKKQQDLEDTWNKSGSAFQVRGCDHDVVYACSRAKTHASTSTGIICSEAKHAPGAEKEKEKQKEKKKH